MTREQARKMFSSLADANGKKHIITYIYVYYISITREQARKMFSSLADANGKKHTITYIYI